MRKKKKKEKTDQNQSGRQKLEEKIWEDKTSSVNKKQSPLSFSSITLAVSVCFVSLTKPSIQVTCLLPLFSLWMHSRTVSIVLQYCSSAVTVKMAF